MLGISEAQATVAVKDIDAARAFYGELLGLEEIPAGPGAVIFRSGNSRLIVYPSRYAGTNRATAVTWNLGDSVQEVVEMLAARGVRFEHYDDLPHTTLQGDLHVSSGHKMAWLKDPDGNILALLGR